MKGRVKEINLCRCHEWSQTTALYDKINDEYLKSNESPSAIMVSWRGLSLQVSLAEGFEPAE